MRIVDFDDGFTTETAPTLGVVTATALKVHANDAAYVTGKGAAAANGDAYYNSTDDMVRIFRANAWEYLNQSKVSDTYAAPSAIVAGTGIAFTSKQVNNVSFVEGSGGAVTVSANPQIAAPAYTGQMLRVFGCSATNTVTLSHGTGLSLLDADVILGDSDSILFMGVGTTWFEVERSS